MSEARSGVDGLVVYVTELASREIEPVAERAVLAAPSGNGLFARIARIQTIQALRYRNYRLLWAGILATAIGTWMEQIAFGWLVWTLTGSTFMVGATQGLRAFPYLFLAPLGGVIADRFDRRLVLLLSQIAPVPLSAVMALLVLTGQAQMWHVIVIGMLGGVFQSVNHPVRHALVPSLVPREHMMNAIALQATGFQLMAVVGPALAGVLLTVIDVGRVFALIAALYSLVLLTTLPISVPKHVRRANQLPAFQSMLEGFRFIAGHRVISSLMLLGFFPIVFGWSVTTLLPTFADHVLQSGASGYGLLQMSLGLGSVVTTIFVASMRGQWPTGKLIIAFVVTLGVGVVAFSLSPVLALAMVFLAIAGGGRMGFMALINTSLQMIAPDEFRGRVMSVVMLQFGLTMFGGFLAGSLADLVSVQVAGAFLGVLCLGAGAYCWLRSPTIRDFR